MKRDSSGVVALQRLKNILKFMVGTLVATVL